MNEGLGFLSKCFFIILKKWSILTLCFEMMLK